MCMRSQVNISQSLGSRDIVWSYKGPVEAVLPKSSLEYKSAGLSCPEMKPKERGDGAYDIKHLAICLSN